MDLTCFGSQHFIDPTLDVVQRAAQGDAVDSATIAFDGGRLGAAGVEISNDLFQDLDAAVGCHSRFLTPSDAT